MKNIEIERRWLLDGFPKLPMLAEVQMEQGYLAFAPNSVRIRRSRGPQGESHILCVKGPGGLQRPEVETPLSAHTYAALAALLPAPPVRKRLRIYKLSGGLTLECSLVDEGEPTAFYYAEVEFDTPEQAAAFVPPAFLGQEKTGEPGFSMAAYYRKKHGL